MRKKEAVGVRYGGQERKACSNGWLCEDWGGMNCITAALVSTFFDGILHLRCSSIVDSEGIQPIVLRPVPE